MIALGLRHMSDDELLQNSRNAAFLNVGEFRV